jgi:Phage tail protein (Tail_P2_I)
MTFTQDLLDALAPMMYAEAQTGNALTDYLSGLGLEFELVESWVSDTDTDIGWSLLLDIDRCPPEALPWLAQIVGLTLPTGLSAADQRNLIRTTPNWKRGTVGALTGAAAPFLTGNKTVILRERYDGSGNDAPYYLQIITYASETPDSSLVLKALMSQKAGGIILTYTVATGQDYQQLKTNRATYQVMKNYYPTYAGVKSDTGV